MSTVSARPDRLERFASTTSAIAVALSDRSGYLADAWSAYVGGNGSDWRFAFGDLPESLAAWGRTLDEVGAWADRVGQALVAADEDGTDGIHAADEDRTYAMLSYEDRRWIDTATLTEEVDWGEPDDPPAWLEDVQATDVAFARVGTGADILAGGFVQGAGPSASWYDDTPLLLTRFASASDAAALSNLLTVGGAGVSGFAAGAQQWFGDHASLAYSDGEMLARASARGGGAAAITFGGSALGSSLAPGMCAPAAALGPLPVAGCAAFVVIGTGVLANQLGNGALDWLIPGPAPAEHDPDIVEDEVRGLLPGHLLRDIPDETRDLLNHVSDQSRAIEDANEAAAERLETALAMADEAPATPAPALGPATAAQVEEYVAELEAATP